MQVLVTSSTAEPLGKGQYPHVSPAFSNANGVMAVVVTAHLIPHAAVWEHVALLLSFSSSEIKGFGAKGMP